MAGWIFDEDINSPTTVKKFKKAGITGHRLGKGLSMDWEDTEHCSAGCTACEAQARKHGQGEEE